MQLTVNTLNLSFFLFIVFYGLNLGAVASPGDLLEKKKIVWLSGCFLFISNSTHSGNMNTYRV